MSNGVQPPAARKSLIVFLHGFNSDTTCWDPLTKLMGADPAMTAGFDWQCFPYDSKVTYGLFNVLSRIPDFDDITAKFDRFLTDHFTSSYDQLYLVGHSQGGLIIQSWLGQVLTDGKATRLGSLREVIFICTPTLGSTIASGARKVVFSLIHDPQETRLRVLDSTVAKTRRMIEERIVQTSVRSDTQWPVPILAIWGQQDNVVSATSAQASFVNLETVEGDHSSVLKPANRTDDDRYTVVADALLRPYGHLHIFEVDRYETTVKVEPMANPKYLAKRPGQTTEKLADDFARITRTVTFSAKNRCVDLFHLNYQTGPAGFLEASFDEVGRQIGASAPDNEAPGDMQERWARGENDVTYDFRPVSGKAYVYEVQVWAGFAAGNRTVHFHFEGNTRCREYVFTVDLSAYVAAGWTVSEVPRLYVDPSRTEEHQIGEQRLPANLLTCTSSDPLAGKWMWVMHDFRGGIVDAVWDVAKAAGIAG